MLAPLAAAPAGRYAIEREFGARILGTDP